MVQHVLSKGIPHVYAIGFSAGSNCLIKYVGETGAKCALKAAMSVANGYDISNGLSYIRKNAWMLDRWAAPGSVCMWLQTRGVVLAAVFSICTCSSPVGSPAAWHVSCLTS